MSGFTITSETQAYKRYLTVFDRQITYPDGRTAAFDIVGHPRSSFQFAVVFVYWSERKRVTLLREFAQAAAGLVYNFPTGSYDAGKDASLQQSAARELSEEAGLTGGTWHRLLDDDHPGILEGKWCSNRFTPFLVIDPVQAEPQSRRARRRGAHRGDRVVGRGAPRGDPARRAADAVGADRLLRARLARA